MTSWKSRGPDDAYVVEEIEDRLKAQLPGWSFDDGYLVRLIKTGGWKASLMVVNAVGHLAELAWHHPELSLEWGQVVVRLATHSAKGITHKDFELAAKIDQFVDWRPATEDGALTGTPDDPRYVYIKPGD